MRIACELRLFPEARNRTVALNDPTCLARDNRTHLIIHTALDDCGTQVEVSPAHRPTNAGDNFASPTAPHDRQIRVVNEIRGEK